jgi:hypothetical protein
MRWMFFRVFLTSGRKSIALFHYFTYPVSIFLQTPTNGLLHSAYLSIILHPSLNPINQIRLLPTSTHPLILQPLLQFRQSSLA